MKIKLTLLGLLILGNSLFGSDYIKNLKVKIYNNEKEKALEEMNFYKKFISDNNNFTSFHKSDYKNIKKIENCYLDSNIYNYSKCNDLRHQYESTSLLLSFLENSLKEIDNVKTLTEYEQYYFMTNICKNSMNFNKYYDSNRLKQIIDKNFDSIHNKELTLEQKLIENKLFMEESIKLLKEHLN